MATQIVGSADLADQQIPTEQSNEIIQDTIQSSVVLGNARRTTMGTRTKSQPVLDALPSAAWVNGETGLKQTSKFSFKDTKLHVEELAVIIPIPDAVADDSNIDLWGVARPLAAEAIGAAVDAAILFGTNKPLIWGDAIVPGAIAAGNSVMHGTNSDLGADVAELAKKTVKGGGKVNGFVSEPGLNWELVGLRNSGGMPIYNPGSLAGGQPSTLYGYGLNEVTTGVWNEGAAKLAAVDWSKVVVGVRQDITYDIFREGVITEDDGAGGQRIVYNLMQQDMKALRVVFRLAYATAQPIARISGQHVFPAGVITPYVAPTTTA